jgi:branched-chain amino acid aminotransferase
MSIRVYINGQVVRPEAATVSVLDRGFLFGDSVYETLACFDGRPVFLGEHLDRLERSAQHLYLDLPARALIETAIRQTVAATGEMAVRVRIMVTRGAGTIDLDPRTATNPSLIVIAQPLGAPTDEVLEKGVAVALAKASRVSATGVSPKVKSGNYLGSVLAIAEARQKFPTANEALMCSTNGSLAEGATSNVFLVEEGVLSTPAIDVGILDGVTRTKVLALARAQDLPTREESFLAPDRLHSADEVFLTSAVRGILPVTSVDGQPVGDAKPGPITRRLWKLYQQLMSEAGWT